MKGYKFNTEQEAQGAVSQCDAHYGYPKQDCVTQHWCDYTHAQADGFYYMAYDDTLVPVLGEPTEFEVTAPNQE